MTYSTLLTEEELKTIEDVFTANDGRKPDVVALLSHIAAQAAEIAGLSAQLECHFATMSATFAKKTGETEQLQRAYERRGGILKSLRRKLKNTRIALRNFGKGQAAFVREGREEILANRHLVREQAAEIERLKQIERSAYRG